MPKRLAKFFVTTGFRYTDIDGLACCIAYTELLQLEGKNARAFLPGPLNQSCIDELRSPAQGLYVQDLNSDDLRAQFIIMDLNVLTEIDQRIKPQNIIELYDHHMYGELNYWYELKNFHLVLEDIGACATLVWREYIKRGLRDKISQFSAKLLYSAIISNTNNFHTLNTKDEDINTAKELKAIANLSDDYLIHYFENVEKSIYANLDYTIKYDSKNFNLNGKNYCIIQLELWDSLNFITSHESDLRQYLLQNEDKDYQFITAPSIKDNKNYFLCFDKASQQMLNTVFGVKFTGNIGLLDHIILRKEIKQKLYSALT